ncbi:MAG: hypothetical protein HYZ71_02425 [Deltaproteobacteria bacterium]|nr:hypothetical protein [Deltaproteobacteria bacterium]
MRQIVPAALGPDRFLKDRAGLYDALKAEKFDASLYSSAFNPYPIAVSASHYAELRELQSALREVLKAIVQNFFTDSRIRDVIALKEPEMALLREVETLPYRMGSFRPDILYAADGTPLISEVNARFPINGYLASAILNRVVQKHMGLDPLPGMVELENYLAERLGPSGLIGIVRSSEPGWDIHLLKQWWPGQCVSRPPESVTESEMARWGSLVLELAQEEIVSAFEPPVRTALVKHPHLLNDVRTILIVHDKRLLSLISRSPVIDDYVSVDLIARVRRHTVPTWVKGLHSDEMSRAEAEGDWIAKPPRSGKGRGIIVSRGLERREWAQTLRQLPPDWIVQPYVEQLQFPVCHMVEEQLVTENMNLVGLLPAIDDHPFGCGLFRASASPIVNVARGGAILAPYLERST